MISESEARKIYPSNTPVVRRGDRKWTSDNHQAGRLGERYGMNPTSGMVAKMQARAQAEVDTSALEGVTDTAPLGSRMTIPKGRDLVTVELRANEFGDRYWHTCFTQKNGAL